MLIGLAIDTLNGSFPLSLLPLLANNPLKEGLPAGRVPFTPLFDGFLRNTAVGSVLLATVLKLILKC